MAGCMATKAPAANFADEPSIIIDPSVYVPEQPRWLLETVCETFIDVTRVLVAVTFSGTVAFSGAHALMEHRFAPPQPTALALVESAPRAEPLPRASSAQQRPSVAMDLKLAPASELPICEQRSAQAPGQCTGAAAPGAVSAPAKRAVIDVAAGVRMARRMLALNRLDEAEAAYRRVLVVDEHHPAALTGLARVHLARGALDDALVLAQRAVEIAPEQAGGQLALGDALRAKGLHASAPAAQARVEAAAHPENAQVAASGDTLVPQPL